MKNRIEKKVARKLTINQLERRRRKEQRAKGVTLFTLDTSKIKGRLLRDTIAYCEKQQIAFSQFMNEALTEHFVKHGFLPGKAVAA